MTAFWIPAALLALAAAAFLAWPLWRERQRSGRWSVTGLAAAVATLPLAALVYLQVTTYTDPSESRPAGITQEQADIVAQLAERMEENPGDVRGWRLLGQSYMALGEYASARRALLQAWERSPVRDSALKLQMAEAMILTDRSTLGAEAGELIEDVLAEEPQNQRALWYGGFVAIQRGREDVAASRWRTLLDMNPPPELAADLRAQIAALTGEAPQAARASGGAGRDAADGPTISLDIRLGDAVPVDSLSSQAALFIFARAPGGGPPIAVIREPVTAVPGTFTLSDADTMLAGRSLADYDEITLVARISRTGQPAEQPGDYFAQTTYAAADGGSVELVIDQVVP